MKIALSAESTCDLNKELIEKYNVNIIPYTVLLGEEMRLDGTFPTQEIFDFVEKTGILPKTSAINEYQYEEYFNSLLNEYDAVVHICLSSGLTSSTSNAIKVSKRMNNVYVIDSQNLSTGMGLLVVYAGELINKGIQPKEIVEKVQKRIPFVQASFIVERLDYLYKGGRCNAMQAFGANLLKLKPRIVVKDGKMISDKKYRGPIEVCIKKYCEDTLQDFSGPDLTCAFVTYTSATEGMVKAAKEALLNKGFKNVYETTAGATITSHCGEHTLGILYINDAGVLHINGEIE